MQNIELTSTGLVCDNKECDWEDRTLLDEDMANWINKPCPKCGENLLTQEDFDRHEQVIITANFINTLTPEEVEELVACMTNPDQVEEFKKAFPGLVTGRIDTHEKINIEIDKI